MDERELDELYLYEVNYKLERSMADTYVDYYSERHMKNAALSIATARWDSVRSDVSRGKLTKEEAFDLYGKAVRYKVVQPRMAEQQLDLITNL